jgi:hypothetical protein
MHACIHLTFIRFRLFLPYLSCSFRMALEKHLVWLQFVSSMQLSEVPAKNRRKRWKCGWMDGWNVLHSNTLDWHDWQGLLGKGMTMSSAQHI